MSDISIRVYAQCRETLHKVYGNKIPRGAILRMFFQEMGLIRNNQQ